MTTTNVTAHWLTAMQKIFLHLKITVCCMFMQVHNERLHQIGDEDFLREMGIGCDDTGLELTQLSEITANIHCEHV